VETVVSSIPALITVHSSASTCRARNAKRVMQFKHARTATEMQEETVDCINLINERPYLKIEEWSADTINANDQYLGLHGSPTKVKKIDNVILAQKDNKILTGSDQDIEQLMVELLESRVIG
jgi:electron transfer flavoprotein beta subunit